MPLPSDLCKLLERTVVSARNEAESAAAKALKRLGVVTKEVPDYLSTEERGLRNRLRAAARQLGDDWKPDKQTFASLKRLTHEVAYEHWHRMLFARFLAENSLLIHPEHRVSVDLATIAELAQEESAKTGKRPDTWALAGRFAAAMLPQIFRPDDPALAVQLAPEHQQALESILESLPPQVFTADDALGWVYQFWQSAEKKRVNEAGDKITGETLPAVTQLFTEHYMVLFLLHNTVGAWHAGKQLSNLKSDISNLQSELDLRAAVALPGYAFEYLRFVQSPSPIEGEGRGEGAWRPAAGTFDGWPKHAKELKVLDPCCGSGHFLVAVLELLTRLRMKEEGLSIKDAASAVIRDNLFGLELDARCTQIAAFNVAVAAWRLAGEFFPLPEMHIACAGLAPNCSEEQWLELAEARFSPARRNAGAVNRWLAPLARKAVRSTLQDMHALFSKAPNLGSLIDPAAIAGTLGSADWETAKPFLSDVLAEDSAKGGNADDDAHERAVAAHGMAKAAEILAGEYTLVITNVPYKNLGELDTTIAEFVKREYAESKSDLATVFVSRILAWLGHAEQAGTIAVVTPQNWLFLTSYKKLRERLLRERTWNIVARLGEHAFTSKEAAGAFAAMMVISGGRPPNDHMMAGIDVSASRGQRPIYADEKAALLRGDLSLTVQRPRIPAMSERPASDEGDEAVKPVQGADITTPDGSLKLVPQAEQLKNPDAKLSFEVAIRSALLASFASAPRGVVSGDRDYWVRAFWELSTVADDWRPLQSAVHETTFHGGRETVIWWRTGGKGMLRPGLGNTSYGKPGVTMGQVGPLPCTLYTGELYDNSTFAIVPNDPKHLAVLWTFCSSPAYNVAVRQFNQKLSVDPSHLIKVPFDLAHWQKVAAEKYPNGLPEPQSDDPTQWLFHGHPANADCAAILQVAVARLMGYRWPAELDTKMHLAPDARTRVEKCKDLDKFAADDGVVPLVPINKERPGAERARTLLEAAFGPKWTPGLLDELLAAAGSAGISLDEWLKCGDFFAQHCAMFHQRPFVWQIWDGRKDGFNILVHYHRLAEGQGKGHKLLQKITFTYLGDWITQQQAAAKQGVAGADVRLKAAQDLQKKLEAILAGEPPYDLFVRWKPLYEQPIGWNPDINDGVRVNIRPFIIADVLRGNLSKTNLMKRSDRGKEPESLRPKADFPWFWSCPEDEPPQDFAGGAKFTGKRLNDLHYTNKAKQAARERQ